jgi:hypothetical protein
MFPLLFAVASENQDLAVLRILLQSGQRAARVARRLWIGTGQISGGSKLAMYRNRRL